MKSLRRKPLRLLAAAALVSVPALVVVGPDSVASASATGPTMVTFGPARVGAYTLRIDAYPRARGDRAAVDFSLVRSAGPRVHGPPEVSAFTQSHTFTTRRHVRVDISSDGRSVSVMANLGRYGTIQLVAAHLRSTTSRSCLDDAHRGRARGTVRLTPGGRYFGTIERRALQAQEGSVGACQDVESHARRAFDLIALSKHFGDRTRRFLLLQLSDALKITLTRPGRDVFVQDQIAVNAPPASVLTVSGDGSAATLDGVGPFLSGVAHFRAHDAGPNGITGALSGNLRADFDSPEPIPITVPPIRATLVDR
jgi:hypothetical protein